MHQSFHEKQSITFKSGVFRMIIRINHSVHSLTLNLVSLLTIWIIFIHHQEWKAKYPIQKNLWWRIFPIEMILYKYFLKKTTNKWIITSQNCIRSANKYILCTRQTLLVWSIYLCIYKIQKVLLKWIMHIIQLNF